jgi:glycosyltransferase involved in cell wall biosynthesis
MHKKKILIVYHGLRNIGGGEKSLLEFVEEIRLQNYEISLLYSNRNVVIESLDIYEAEILEIPKILNKYRSKLKIVDFFYCIPDLTIYFIKIYKYLNSHKFDYVYIHDNLNKIVFGLISIFFKLKIVCHLNDVLKFTFLDNLLRFFYLFICTRFVAVSYAAKNSVTLSDLKSCEVIYPFPTISPPLWESHQPNKYFSLLTIGVLDYVKGHDVVINALSWIQSNRPNYKIIYDIIGDGIERNALAQLIKIKCLDNSIFMHGRVENLASFYKNANAVIVPSRQESFGLSYVEAVIRGVPVISSDVDAFRELNKITSCYSFSSGDSISCALEIISMIDNYDVAVKRALIHRHEMLSIKEYPHVKSMSFLFQ